MTNKMGAAPRAPLLSTQRHCHRKDSATAPKTTTAPKTQRIAVCVEGFMDKITVRTGIL